MFPANFTVMSTRYIKHKLKFNINSTNHSVSIKLQDRLWVYLKAKYTNGGQYTYIAVLHI